MSQPRRTSRAVPPPFAGSGVASAEDIAALSTVYDAYADRAYATARMISGTTAGAEDALIDSVLDLSYQRPSRSSAGDAGTWLICRVCRYALDGRRSGRRPVGPLAALTDEQCQVVALAAGGGLSLEEIGTHLAVPASVVARTITAATIRQRDLAARRRDARGGGASRDAARSRDS